MALIQASQAMNETQQPLISFCSPVFAGCLVTPHGRRQPMRTPSDRKPGSRTLRVGSSSTNVGIHASVSSSLKRLLAAPCPAPPLDEWNPVSSVSKSSDSAVDSASAGA